MKYLFGLSALSYIIGIIALLFFDYQPSKAFTFSAFFFATLFFITAILYGKGAK